MSLSVEAPPGDVSSPEVSDTRIQIQRCKDMLASLQSKSDGINAVIDSDEQLARLNIWATNMGVFSEGRKSLALRLHDANEAGELIKGQISMLEFELEKFLGLGGEDTDDEGSEGGSEADSDESKSSSGASSASSYRLAGTKVEPEATTEQGPRLQAWHTIQKTITSLQQLGQIIRRAGAQHRMERIERFKNKEENKSIYEVFFRSALQKADHLFPNASVVLRQRIAESIATRRARFSYLSLHQKKLSTLNMKAPIAAKSRAKGAGPWPPQTGLHPQNQAGFAPGAMPQGQHQGRAPVAGSVMLSNTIDTRLDMIPVRDTESFMKRPESVTSVKIPVGGLPPRPQIDHKSGSFLCPYCCLIYPAGEIATMEGWKNHLIQDFEPYFCTHDDCSSPFNSANSFSKWLAHMRDSHGSKTQWQCWQCRQVSEKKTTFMELKDFEEHLKASHPSETADATYDTLLKYSKVQTRDILPQGCPFCGGTPEELDKLFEDGEKILEAQTALQKHVRGHLVSIAYILAPIAMGEQHDDVDDVHMQVVDEKSDAQRDNSSTHSEAFPAAPDVTCDNPDCDCRAGPKVLEAPASEDQDPAYRSDSDRSTEWQFWHPSSLPPVCKRIGPPVAIDPSNDPKLLTYFGIRPKFVANPPMPEDRRELHTATIQSLGSQVLLYGQPEQFISDPAPGTYEWIWNQKPIHPKVSSEKVPTTGLPEWLRAQESNPYFWITGNMGSGKSTLMRCIFSRNKLERDLSIWRPHVPPFVIAVFSSAPEDPLQHDTHWLVRSILAQALQQEPTLISVFTANSVQVPFEQNTQSSEILDRALSVFLGYCRQGARALLLLVDGLQELMTPGDDIITLITSIRRQAGSNVKICAASQPWPVFQQFFEDSPRIIMHDIVGADIEQYVTHQLRSDMFQRYADTDLADWRKAISWNAMGSFLWARLASRTIQRYALEDKSLSQIKEVISRPLKLMGDICDILAFYVDGEDLHSLARTLLLKDAMSSQSLHFTDLHHVDTEIMLPSDDRFEAEKAFNNWLHVTTGGLLKILPDGSLEYTHPSVREWAAETIAASKEDWRQKFYVPPYSTLIEDFYGLEDDQLDIPAVSRSWRRHIMVNITYHAARVANAPDNSYAADVDFTNKFCKYLREAENWEGENESVWLDPHASLGRSANVFEWAAALAVTQVFEGLDDKTWDILRENGYRMLELAIFGPPKRRLYDWGMSGETSLGSVTVGRVYFNSDMFNSHRRQMVISNLLGHGISVQPYHLQQVLRFEELVGEWRSHEVSCYLRDIKKFFLLPALANSEPGENFRRSLHQSSTRQAGDLIKSAAI